MKENRMINYLRHQSFHPDFFSLFINPFFFTRYALIKNIRPLVSQLTGKLLDFGCGRKPYRKMFQVTEYTGVDIADSGHEHTYSDVDVYYDGRSLPFENETFDALFCSEVLEHVFNPDEVLPEINRVLKKKARVLITVPFCWNEHEIPFDYARYSSFGIKHLLEKHGFRVLKLTKSGNFARVNMQLWALYFFELFRGLGKTGYMFSLLFIIPVNLVGSVLLLFFPVNKSMYFSNIIMAEKNE